LIFVRGAARVKSIRIKRDVNQEPLDFCMRRCACKKYKMERDVNQEPLLFVHGAACVKSIT
jgi:hypothetical protein